MFGLINEEDERQVSGLELIASEVCYLDVLFDLARVKTICQNGLQVPKLVLTFSARIFRILHLAL